MEAYQIRKCSSTHFLHLSHPIDSTPHSSTGYSVVSSFSRYFNPPCLLSASIASIITTLSSHSDSSLSFRPSRNHLPALSASRNSLVPSPELDTHLLHFVPLPLSNHAASFPPFIITLLFVGLKGRRSTRISPLVPWIRIARLAEPTPSMSVATRGFVSAMPRAVCMCAMLPGA